MYGTCHEIFDRMECADGVSSIICILGSILVITVHTDAVVHSVGISPSASSAIKYRCCLHNLFGF